jgi:hypothetical protein
MRRWQEFGFAGQFSPTTPIWNLKPDRGWVTYPPVFVSFPHKVNTFEVLNYASGGGLGDAWSVYATMWQFDFPNWVAPAADCTAQHLPVGSVIFPQSLSARRLLDSLAAGFPPYPPFTNYTPGIIDLSFTKPDKFGG